MISFQALGIPVAPGSLTPNVEVTGAARPYRAASVWTAGLAVVAWCNDINSTHFRCADFSFDQNRANPNALDVG